MGQARNGDKSKAGVNLRSWKRMSGRTKIARVKGPGPGWQKVPNVTQHPLYTYLDLVQFCPRWVVIVRVYDDEAVYCMQQYSTRIYYLLLIHHLQYGNTCPRMNSFLSGMNSFLFGMNSFLIGMNSFWV